MRLSRQLRPVFATLLIFLFLLACSRAEFVYERADWFGARWAANYLDLDRQQRRQIRDELATYREFHREVRVPQIQALLESAISDLESGHHERETIAGHLATTETLLGDMTRDLLPLVSDVLADLDRGQQAQLEQRFEKRRKESREELARRAHDDWEEQRRERFLERAESLLGSLTAGQKARITRCADAMPDTAAAQLEWEIDRQNRLLAMIADGYSADRIHDYLEGWWLHYRDQPEPLSQARQERQQVTLACLADLLPTLNQGQRDKLAERLTGYARNLEQLRNN
ncbi:DUF6279 family lipoprotein [Natronospira bacteriovora]|uniref:DUF6279 family lipoprotein n=1 Tax=Natronospira bacteriovora TaxID=3069753 RepID=A0ABU0W9V4_9GAMM|nr:DUF6279 family lipoprotein [Natronospira sp. AB-CW4]MDQ2070742.1 DUF6279 family lipoprotein [Natronospira sp. AB-CW4]